MKVVFKQEEAVADASLRRLTAVLIGAGVVTTLALTWSLGQYQQRASGALAATVKPAHSRPVPVQLATTAASHQAASGQTASDQTASDQAAVRTVRLPTVVITATPQQLAQARALRAQHTVAAVAATATGAAVGATTR